MTEPKALSSEARVELVAKAKAVDAPNLSMSAWREARGAFEVAADPSSILAYEATVVALEAAAKGWEDANRVNVIKLAAALERVKALEAGAKPFIDAALQIPAEVEDFKVIAHVPGGPNAKAYLRVSELLTAGAFRQARAALHPEPLGEGGGL